MSVGSSESHSARMATARTSGDSSSSARRKTESNDTSKLASAISCRSCTMACRRSVLSSSHMASNAAWSAAFRSDRWYRLAIGTGPLVSRSRASTELKISSDDMGLPRDNGVEDVLIGDDHHQQQQQDHAHQVDHALARR